MFIHVNFLRSTVSVATALPFFPVSSVLNHDLSVTSSNGMASFVQMFVSEKKKCPCTRKTSDGFKLNNIFVIFVQFCESMWLLKYIEIRSKEILNH